MSLLDFIYPKRCVGCGKVGEYVCANCFSFISFTEHGFCTVCQKGSIDGLTHPVCRMRYEIDGVFASLKYAGVVRRLIRQFKYKPYISDLRGLLNELMYEGIIQKEIFVQLLKGKSAFVPIPLHKSKMRQRGYNQAKVLTEGLIKKLKLERTVELSGINRLMTEDLLERIRETKPQFGLSLAERMENMKGAFEIRMDFLEKLKGTSAVFVVDDIVTTGATFREASRVLKKAGIQRVYGVALAHG